jgi:hypothetical protein
VHAPYPSAIPKSMPLRSDEYYRLQAACFVMARQSDLPEMRTRWLNMAQACLKLANAVPAPPVHRPALTQRSPLVRFAGWKPTGCRLQSRPASLEGP